MPILGHRLTRLVDMVFGHALLVVLGFYYVPTRRMTFRSSGGGGSGSGSGEIALTLAKDRADDSVHPGDILLCNCQSPIDVIYLCAKFSPTFTTVARGSGAVHACSRWFVLLNCAYPGVMESGHRDGILRISSCAHGPVVVFPEGTTSNGRALLPWIADLTKLPDNQRMHVIALKYALGGGGFSPTLPTTGVLTLIRFFLSASRQWYNSLSVKWVSSSTIYASEHIAAPAAGDFGEKGRAVMAALLHVRTVGLTLKDKADFLRAYQRTRLH